MAPVEKFARRKRILEVGNTKEGRCDASRGSRCLLFLLLLSGIGLAVPGCAGYQIGEHSLFRPDLRTVYVPVFESSSFRRNLGERLTEAVIKEIDDRTPYKVVQNTAADSVLIGRLVSESKSVLAEDVNDVPREIETNLVVEINWYDRYQRLITHTTTLSISPVILSVAETASFIPEAGQSMATSQQEAIDRLARQIVGQMELPW